MRDRNKRMGWIFIPFLTALRLRGFLLLLFLILLLDFWRTDLEQVFFNACQWNSDRVVFLICNNLWDLQMKNANSHTGDTDPGWCSSVEFKAGSRDCPNILLHIIHTYFDATVLHTLKSIQVIE